MGRDRDSPEDVVATSIRSSDGDNPISRLTCFDYLRTRQTWWMSACKIAIET